MRPKKKKAAKAASKSPPKDTSKARKAAAAQSADAKPAASQPATESATDKTLPAASAAPAPQPERAPTNLGLRIPPAEPASASSATAASEPEVPVAEEKIPETPWPKPAAPSQTSSKTPLSQPRGKQPEQRRPDRPQRRVPEFIPPILLERDTPGESSLSGPGERYALGPTPPPEHFPKGEEVEPLPESYGTGRLFLTARDPHWLYAAWDLPRDEQQRCNSVSMDGHLIVRTYLDILEGTPAAEVHVHPESRNWFVHVDDAGRRYIAELGYRDTNGTWNRIAVSDATVTPPDTLSEDTSVQFATLPAEVSFDQLLEAVESAVRETAPAEEPRHEAEAKAQAPKSEQTAAPVEMPGAPESAGAHEPQFPSSSTAAEEADRVPVTPKPHVPPQPAVPGGASAPTPPPTPSGSWPARAIAAPSPQRHAHRAHLQEAAPPKGWTPTRERALAEVIRLDEYRRVWMGSVEITELVKRHLRQPITSPPGIAIEELPGGQLAPGAAAAPGSVTVPFGAGEKPKHFWFNVNAEIVIYGATEPDARVTIAGRKIRLRPDGTFSYRFALPDGDYELPITAESPDEADQRSAALEFSRATHYAGDVGQHPQSPELRPPVAASL